MRWMQTCKIPLQTPIYSKRVSYYRYNKGGKCTHTISLQSPSSSKVFYYNIRKGKYTHKVSQNLNTPTHKTYLWTKFCNPKMLGFNSDHGGNFRVYVNSGGNFRV